MSIKAFNSIMLYKYRTKKTKPTVFVNRTCRLKTAQEKGLDHVKGLAIQNLKDLLDSDWCYDHGIKSYRMSSDMFPHAGNPRYGEAQKVQDTV